MAAVATTPQKLKAQADALVKRASLGSAASEGKARVATEALTVLAMVEQMSSDGKAAIDYKISMLDKLADIFEKLSPAKIASPAVAVGIRMDFSGVPKSKLLEIRSVIDGAKVES